MADETTTHNCTSKDCILSDDDLMVACETCGRWWHYSCAKFDPSLFDTATPWYCHTKDCYDVAENQKQEGAQSVDAAEKGDPEQMSDVLDYLIEAAKVAQTTVDEKDNEISLLKAEMDALKSKLVSTTMSAPVQRKEKPVVIKNIASDKLEAVRQIERRHRQILESSSRGHSTSPSLKPQAAGNVPDSSLSQETDMVSLLTLLTRNQVQELPSFSGHDQKEWPYFESVYKSTTLEGRFNNRENVARLRKALAGEAYNLVSDRLRYSTDADAIMNTLRTIYGRSDVLVYNLTTNLLMLSVLNSGSDSKLRQ